MKSSILSVSIVSMALANFTANLPHGLDSRSMVVGGQSGLHLFCYQLGQKRQATKDASEYYQSQSMDARPVNQNTNRRMELLATRKERVGDKMGMARSEADFSFPLTTFSLPQKYPLLSDEEKYQTNPTIGNLRHNYAELADWANNVDYVRSDLMEPADFETVFPLVAYGLDKGRGDTKKLETMTNSLNIYGYRRDYFTLATAFPGLARITLPENLARQTPSRIPYLVKGHLAAHLVRAGNIKALRQMIETWITSGQEIKPTAPQSSGAVDTNEPDVMPDVDDFLLELPHLVGSDEPSIEVTQAKSRATSQNKPPNYLSGEPTFNYDGAEELRRSPFRLTIATLYLWAMEYKVPEYQSLFAEFGDPFIQSDITCMVALLYTNADSHLLPVFPDDFRSLTPADHLRCYQNFSFQSYVVVPPKMPVVVSSNYDTLLKDNMDYLSTMAMLINDMENRKTIRKIMIDFRPLANSLVRVIQHMNYIASSESVEPSQRIAPNSPDLTSADSSNRLVQKLNSFLELFNQLSQKIISDDYSELPNKGKRTDVDIYDINET
ncbi:hypothetical protein BJ085DRAFT_30003 [Dimargaris cristalligena]|uniref:Uncharacterized protein n=1 Tax=Dimargaris cristalligena TaxID=215637 RepID=A0A4Q0A0P1_9FUNG|nr:hypothetical protein BJ085DRAFT_30003 [Dimargaris cristalligena]|eukprot:RKP39666.1 hypothetical protein BJ085DRAFT_30003 [Dimargaris cristalligena]